MNYTDGLLDWFGWSVKNVKMIGSDSRLFFQFKPIRKTWESSLHELFEQEFSISGIRFWTFKICRKEQNLSWKLINSCVEIRLNIYSLKYIKIRLPPSKNCYLSRVLPVPATTRLGIPERWIYKYWEKFFGIFLDYRRDSMLQKESFQLLG